MRPARVVVAKTWGGLSNHTKRDYYDAWVSKSASEMILVPIGKSSSASSIKIPMTKVLRKFKEVMRHMKF